MSDFDFQGQPSRSRDLFWFIWDPRPRICWNQHQDQVCSMYTTRDTRGHVGVWLTLIFKVNHQGHKIYFHFFDISDLKNARIDTKIKSVSWLQPEITKVIPVHMYDLDFQGQPSRSRNLFWFIRVHRPWKCWNRHQDHLCTIITSLVMKGQFWGSSTLNFKVIRQGHVINSNIFEFPDLENVRNNTNLIALSRILRKISW